MSAAAPPIDGWMLLHVATAVDDPAALLDRFGIAPNGDRLTIGRTSIQWVEGTRAIAVGGALASDDAHLIGIASVPDLSAGHVLAFRLTAGEPVTAKSILRLCTTVGLVSSALDAAAIGWAPANLWSSASMFGEAIVAVERQGLPPIMHLVAFEASASGIHTYGLSCFCGHELRLSAPSGYPEREALRRAARLAIGAFMHDGLAGPMTVAGIDKGEVLVIGERADGEPSPYVPVELRPPPG